MQSKEEEICPEEESQVPGSVIQKEEVYSHIVSESNFALEKAEVEVENEPQPEVFDQITQKQES